LVLFGCHGKGIGYVLYVYYALLVQFYLLFTAKVKDVKHGVLRYVSIRGWCTTRVFPLGICYVLCNNTSWITSVSK